MRGVLGVSRSVSDPVGRRRRESQGQNRTGENPLSGIAGRPVETWPIVVKEITVVGSRCGPFVKALAFLRSRKVDPTPLITRTFSLTEAAKAIQFAQESEAMKVLLKP